MHDSEKELLKVKDKYQYLKGPDDKLDQAIRAGINQAKGRRSSLDHMRHWMLSGAAAIILLVLFAGAIHQSDLVAGYVRKVPGMEKIVELVHQDKGLVDLIHHDFVQTINKSDSHGGLTLTVKNIIADDQQLIMYYTFTNENHESFKDLQIKSMKLKDSVGEEIKQYSLEYGPDVVEGDRKKTELQEAIYGLHSPLTDSSYSLNVELEGDKKLENTVWKVPIKLDRSKMGANKDIVLNKEVKVQQQSVLVKDITFSPTRVAVQVEYPEENSKQVLNIEDLQLVDEKGEVWSKITNGISASGDGNHVTYYLESNYFKKPKQLYLVFHKLQALDKDELEVVVNPKDQKILKAPKDGKITAVQYNLSENQLEFKIKGDFHIGSPFSKYKNDQGEFKYLSGNTYMNSYDNDITGYGLTIPQVNPVENLTLLLGSYPAYINGDVKIRIK
ncbi:DUF4179 domain-containing protein [Falsibacillus pallidus]|uniref:Uncharacterized protein DUF4179 n=1 Tax=Falsibacillus pallidus TaxID=493781 RepID=A0A370GQ79_9BACI|nr:DUF4179 domain-containing protein [Falsibacillus pallidus]RDI45549.1 uncharacterized protein DUF4179 [Falsibacillus pallidus]